MGIDVGAGDQLVGGAMNIHSLAAQGPQDLRYYIKLSLEAGKGKTCPQPTSAMSPGQPSLAAEETGHF